jgi:hypothetical protein
VLLFRFLVPRPVGMADNGDGWRLLCKLGGRPLNPVSERYVVFHNTAATTCHSDYVTSQMWFDVPAQWIGRVFGDTGTLNLYVLGVLCCVLAAAGIALIVAGLGLPRPWQLVSAALLVLVVADSAFFGYFASVLSEAAALLGILLLVGGLLLIQREDRWRYFGAGVTVAGALIAVNAKTQMLVLLPLLVVALLVMKWSRRWVLPVVVVVVVGGGTALMQTTGSAAGAEYTEANMYHAIFDSIVDGSHDTEADLAALGLPPSFARFVGTGWWAPGSGQFDPEYARYRHLITRSNVAKYYFSHPWRTVQILQKAAQDQLTARAPNLGSYALDSGEPPQAQEFRVPVLSGLTRLVAPLGLFFLVPLWSFTLWGGLSLRRLRRDVSVVVLLLLGTAISQFVLAALLEGVEGVKHQTIGLFCGLLAALIQAPVLLRARVSQRSRSPEPAPSSTRLRVGAWSGRLARSRSWRTSERSRYASTPAGRRRSPRAARPPRSLRSR